MIHDFLMAKHAAKVSLNISMQIGQFHYQDLNVRLLNNNNKNKKK